MLISDFVYVSWNSKNKKRYEELGYTYTKMGDKFLVRTTDLPPYSQVLVEYKCDYCGKIHSKMWYNYRKARSILPKDSCDNLECLEKKSSESLRKKYGDRGLNSDIVNAKRNQTVISRYGCENPFQADRVKEKIRETNTAKYGAPYSMQNKDIQAKAARTCQERYGVDYYVEMFSGKFIGENSPVWKGGVEYHRKERATHEYIDWRKSVFSRDEYTCQRCGAKNGHGRAVELNAHHILNWRDNPEDRYDI